jgi:hypothetical protein
VAEPHAFVTDTHPLVLHAAGGRSLGRRAARCFAACERREAIIYVPSAVLWELGLLLRVGKVRMDRPLRAFAADLDALVCAAARALALPLITRGQDIEAWALVRSVW